MRNCVLLAVWLPPAAAMAILTCGSLGETDAVRAAESSPSQGPNLSLWVPEEDLRVWDPVNPNVNPVPWRVFAPIRDGKKRTAAFRHMAIGERVRVEGLAWSYSVADAKLNSAHNALPRTSGSEPRSVYPVADAKLNPAHNALARSSGSEPRSVCPAADAKLNPAHNSLPRTSASEPRRVYKPKTAAPTCRVVFEGGTVLVDQVDFNRPEIRGKPVRVEGILRRKSFPPAGFMRQFPEYYCIEAEAFEVIDQVSDPRVVRVPD